MRIHSRNPPEIANQGQERKCKKSINLSATPTTNIQNNDLKINKKEDGATEIAKLIRRARGTNQVTKQLQAIKHCCSCKLITLSLEILANAYLLCHQVTQFFQSTPGRLVNNHSRSQSPMKSQAYQSLGDIQMHPLSISQNLTAIIPACLVVNLLQHVLKTNHWTSKHTFLHFFYAATILVDVISLNNCLSSSTSNNQLEFLVQALFPLKYLTNSVNQNSNTNPSQHLQTFSSTILSALLLIFHSFMLVFAVKEIFSLSKEPTKVTQFCASEEGEEETNQIESTSRGFNDHQHHRDAVLRFLREGIRQEKEQNNREKSPNIKIQQAINNTKRRKKNRQFGGLELQKQELIASTIQGHKEDQYEDSRNLIHNSTEQPAKSKRDVSLLDFGKKQEETMLPNKSQDYSFDSQVPVKITVNTNEITIEEEKTIKETSECCQEFNEEEVGQKKLSSPSQFGNQYEKRHKKTSLQNSIYQQKNLGWRTIPKSQESSHNNNSGDTQIEQYNSSRFVGQANHLESNIDLSINVSKANESFTDNKVTNRYLQKIPKHKSTNIKQESFQYVPKKSLHGQDGMSREARTWFQNRQKQDQLKENESINQQNDSFQSKNNRIQLNESSVKIQDESKSTKQCCERGGGIVAQQESSKKEMIQEQNLQQNQQLNTNPKEEMNGQKKYEEYQYYDTSLEKQKEKDNIISSYQGQEFSLISNVDEDETSQDPQVGYIDDCQQNQILQQFSEKLQNSLLYFKESISSCHNTKNEDNKINTNQGSQSFITVNLDINAISSQKQANCKKFNEQYLLILKQLMFFCWGKEEEEEDEKHNSISKYSDEIISNNLEQMEQVIIIKNEENVSQDKRLIEKEVQDKQELIEKHRNCDVIDYIEKPNDCENNSQIQQNNIKPMGQQEDVEKQSTMNTKLEQKNQESSSIQQQIEHLGVEVEIKGKFGNVGSINLNDTLHFNSLFESLCQSLQIIDSTVILETKILVLLCLIDQASVSSQNYLAEQLNVILTDISTQYTLQIASTTMNSQDLCEFERNLFNQEGRIPQEESQLTIKQEDYQYCYSPQFQSLYQSPCQFSVNSNNNQDHLRNRCKSETLSEVESNYVSQFHPNPFHMFPSPSNTFDTFQQFQFNRNQEILNTQFSPILLSLEQQQQQQYQQSLQPFFICSNKPHQFSSEPLNFNNDCRKNSTRDATYTRQQHPPQHFLHQPCPSHLNKQTTQHFQYQRNSMKLNDFSENNTTSFQNVSSPDYLQHGLRKSSECLSQTSSSPNTQLFDQMLWFRSLQNTPYLLDQGNNRQNQLNQLNRSSNNYNGKSRKNNKINRNINLQQHHLDSQMFSNELLSNLASLAQPIK